MGSVTSYSGVSLEINEGEIVGMLGRNGVGKTTTLRSIMGLTPPHSGTIKFDGEQIMGKQPFQIARRGMGFVPEDRIIFPDLTVCDNLRYAARKGKHGEGWTLERIYSMFPILKEREKQEGGTLSGGGATDAYYRQDTYGKPPIDFVGRSR